MDPELRESLCEHLGGYEAYSAKLQEEIRQAKAKQLEQRPVDKQRAAVDARLRKAQRARDDAADALEALKAEQVALQEKLSKQEAKFAEQEDELQRATRESMAMLQRMAGANSDAARKGDVQGNAGAGSDADRNGEVVSVASVRQFLGGISGALVENDPARDAFKKVMAIVDQAAAAAAELPQEELDANDDMDMEDSMLTSLAAAAVPPAEQADAPGAAEARAAKVAEAKARMLACRPPGGRDKVRRTGSRPPQKT